MDFAWYVVVFGAGVIVGLVSMFFVMRNNPKYFEIDEMLKAKRNEIWLVLKQKGLEVSEEVKKAIDGVF